MTGRVDSELRATPSARIDEGMVGEHRTVRVIRDNGLVVADVSLRGAALLSWRVRTGGGDLDLIDGYRTSSEIDEQAGCRSAIMAPFTNRIEGGQFTFEGQRATFPVGESPFDDGVVLHGLARFLDFSVAEVVHDKDATIIVFRNSEIRPNKFPGYPFAIDLAVRYTFGVYELAIDVIGTNVGASTAPFSAGWHPYFRIDDTPLELLELEIPAATRVATDENLLPLPGAAAYVPLGGASDVFDFTHPRYIGDQMIDSCYVDVRPSPDGRVHTTLTDPARGLGLDVWQERGGVHAYTADALERDPRRSLAIEPVEVITNAFNRSDQSAAIRLEPGETRTFRFGVRVTTDANDDPFHLKTPLPAHTPEELP
ncbi:aldose 1-epimerase [Cryobacterium glaciale]|uniref:Aldose 1-epimerase n=1 Tax=Cryobacterium glaciale TaxID=1259145 RepID=A0A4R8V089_9MICO|nr:aldose 1-epimerase [Cryobacterium glaciale]TFB74991.1 aldose 1-epimerase [Cryobacterium glaciale]